MNPILPLLIAGAAVIVLSKKKAVKKTSKTPSLSGPVSVDTAAGAHFLVFEAEWCVACKKAKPLLMNIRDKHPRIKFSFIDIDSNVDLANKYAIDGIPTVVAIVDGKEVDRVVGVGSVNPYDSMISKVESGMKELSGA